eukprot:6131225-Pyramimonas_sp.AAC.1
MGAIAADMGAQLWKTAKDIYRGPGMQHGMGATMLKKTQQKLRKSDRVQEVGALEAPACGTVWTGQRFKDAGCQTDGVCPWC